MRVPSRGLSARIGRSILFMAVAASLVPGPRVSAQTCTAPNPADRPPAAQQYFMIIVDSSGSMTTTVTQNGVPLAPSCSGYPTDRFGHARCAVRNTIANFSDRADFGLAQFATIATGVTAPCFGNPNVSCYQAEVNTTGSCTGCGPRPGNATTRAGARILVPITTDNALLQSYVDNNCLNPEIGPPAGNTPLNGALRDMKRYFSSSWTEPDGSHTFTTPLASNTLFCRRVNVILITDGDETCDTLADAVNAAADLFQNGVTVGGHNYKVRTYVINFAGGDVGQTDMIAAAGGTGNSLFATNEAQLNAALNQILTPPPETLNGIDDNCNGCVDDGISQLSLSKTASQPTQRRNGGFSYTITGNNAGPTFAEAKLVDPLPASLTLSSFTPPAGWTCNTPAIGSTGTITCTIGVWGLNTPAVFTVGVQVAANAVLGPLTNTATLSASYGASPAIPRSATMSIVANQPPHANAGPNQSLGATLGCKAEAHLDGSASTDPDGDPLTYTWTSPGQPTLTGPTQTVTLSPGSYDFTLTVDDGQGGTSSATVNVLVTDTIAPTISAPPDVVVDSTGSCSAAAALGTPVADDNCGPPVITRSPAGNVFPVGTTDVVWTATDAAGHTATAVQKVTVVDRVAPNVVAGAPATFSTGANATACGLVVSDQDLPRAVATDDCGGAVTVTRSGVPAGNFFPIGTTTITYTATDAAGNHSSASTTVTVNDTTPPAVTAPASLTLGTGSDATACGLTVADSILGSATATDNCPNVQVSRSGVPAANFFPVGTTTVTYTATDAAGNSTTATQTVKVSDTTPPVITLNGDNPMTLSCRTAYQEPGATALDNCDGDTTSAITISGNVDATTPGTYTVSYTVADASGNTSTLQRTVVVADDAPPVITAASASPNKLWPPNHKMVPVTVSAAATSACGGSTSCSVVSVTSNEPINGLGDGDQSPDWQISGGMSVLLRAERSGTGTGRVYTITVRCVNAAGKSSEKKVTVTVPHDN